MCDRRYFHGTARENLPSIAERGLLTPSALHAARELGCGVHGFAYWLKHGADLVYLTPEPEDADMFACLTAGGVCCRSDFHTTRTSTLPPVVLCIEPEGDRMELETEASTVLGLEWDGHDFIQTGPTVAEWVHHGPIPASRIFVHADDGDCTPVTSH
jgi:hypothetical protein